MLALSPSFPSTTPCSLVCGRDPLPPVLRPHPRWLPLVRPAGSSHPVNGGGGASNNGGGWVDPGNPIHKRRQIQQRRSPDSAALRRGRKCSREPKNDLSIQSAEKPSKLTQQRTPCPWSSPRRRSEPASGNAPLLTPCAVLLQM
jgi:hypothetical protein